jgi:hypothetical protein
MKVIAKVARRTAKLLFYFLSKTISRLGSLILHTKLVFFTFFLVKWRKRGVTLDFKKMNKKSVGGKPLVFPQKKRGVTCALLRKLFAAKKVLTSS